MQIDRVQADRALALLGFTLSFLFLLAVVAFAFTVGSDTKTRPPSPVERGKSGFVQERGGAEDRAALPHNLMAGCGIEAINAARCLT